MDNQTAPIFIVSKRQRLFYFHVLSKSWIIILSFFYDFFLKLKKSLFQEPALYFIPSGRRETSIQAMEHQKYVFEIDSLTWVPPPYCLIMFNRLEQQIIVSCAAFHCRYYSVTVYLYAHCRLLGCTLTLC